MNPSTPATPSVPEEGREPRTEFYWLIERGQPEGLAYPEYWGVSDSRTGAYSWLRSPFAADQFGTKAEAEAMIARFNRPGHPFHARAVEHGFIATPASTPSHDGLRDDVLVAVQRMHGRAVREMLAATSELPEDAPVTGMGGEMYAAGWDERGQAIASLPAASTASTGLDVLPTFEVGQVVGDLQPGRRRHDWCSIHGDIGPAESINAHAERAHGSSAEAIRKARKVLKRAARLVPSTEATEAAGEEAGRAD